VEGSASTGSDRVEETLAMRRIALYLLLVLAAITCWGKDESVEELKARLDRAPAEERTELCIRIAQHQLRHADGLYHDGNVEAGKAAVDDLVVYAEKARDFAIQTKKRLKNVEIDARKMSERLRDLKQTLAAEDQPPIDQAIKRLEDIRTDLLKEMFSKKKAKE
jgi:hypothetical protein